MLCSRSQQTRNTVEMRARPVSLDVLADRATVAMELFEAAGQTAPATDQMHLVDMREDVG